MLCSDQNLIATVTAKVDDEQRRRRKREWKTVTTIDDSEG